MEEMDFACHCFNIYLHFYNCRIHLTSILGGGGVFYKLPLTKQMKREVVSVMGLEVCGRGSVAKSWNSLIVVPKILPLEEFGRNGSL